MRRTHYVQSALLLSALMISGCGGGGGGSAIAGPSLDILWPAQTRSITAPESAGRAKITVTRSSGGESVNWEVSRPSDTAAHTVTSTGPALGGSGDVQVLVEFFPEGPPDVNAPAPLGKVSVGAALDPDGKLVDPNNSSDITVTVSDQVDDVDFGTKTLVPGESMDVWIYGFTPSDDHVYELFTALPPKYIDATLDAGSSVASLTKDATGVHVTTKTEGDFNVTAHYGSFTKTKVFHVLPTEVAQQSYKMTTNGVAWNATNGTVWAGFNSHGVPYQDCIAQIDPNTGTITNRISTGLADAHLLAISPDGTKAYVDTTFAGVAIVDLSTGSIVSHLGVDANMHPVSCLFNPTNSSEVTLGSGGAGFVTYLNGVDQPVDTAIRYASPIAYLPNGSLLAQVDGVAHILSASGGTIHSVASRAMPAGPYGTPVYHYAGGKLVFWGGTMWNGTNLTDAGSLDLSTSTPSPLSHTANLWYIGSEDPLDQWRWVIRAYDTSAGARAGSGLIPVPHTEMPTGGLPIPYGTSGLIVATTTAIHFIPAAPGR